MVRVQVFLQVLFCPHRLAWPRTLPFQGSNTGSNPVGDTKLVFHLLSPDLPFHSSHSVEFVARAGYTGRRRLGRFFLQATPPEMAMNG